MLKFLEHEFYRYETFGTPLSLIVFEMAHAEPLPMNVLTTAALRIALACRRSDIIAHFEASEFAILCPTTNVHKAALIATATLESLLSTPLAPGFDRNSLRLAFGIASLPEDGDDLQSLFNAAKIAKSRAKLGAFPIAMSTAAV